MINSLSKLIIEVLTALYEPFWLSVILTVLTTFFLMYSRLLISDQRAVPDSPVPPAGTPASYGSAKDAIDAWLDNIRTSNSFRFLILFVFYLYMVLFRTILRRGIWPNPLENILGIWSFHELNPDTGEIEFSTQIIENIILFVPFSFLFLMSSYEQLFERVTFFKSVWIGTKYTFVISFFIELLQLVTVRGTWQLSDLVFNTLGGLIGSIIFFIFYCLFLRKR